MTVSSSAVQAGEINAYSFYFISLDTQKSALSNLSCTKFEVRKEEVHPTAGCGHTRLGSLFAGCPAEGGRSRKGLQGGPGKECQLQKRRAWTPGSLVQAQ